MFSCGETGLSFLRHREDQHVDNRRGGSSRGGGRHYNNYPVLETLPHWQTGIPARHHEHHPAKTEGERERLEMLSNDLILKHCFSWQILTKLRFNRMWYRHFVLFPFLSTKSADVSVTLLISMWLLWVWAAYLVSDLNDWSRIQASFERSELDTWGCVF